MTTMSVRRRVDDDALRRQFDREAIWDRMVRPGDRRVRHRLIDAFNLGFTEPGADRILGARRSVLPFSAVVVADRAGTVRYAEVRPGRRASRTFRHPPGAPLLP